MSWSYYSSSYLFWWGCGLDEICFINLLVLGSLSYALKRYRKICFFFFPFFFSQKKLLSCSRATLLALPIRFIIRLHFSTHYLSLEKICLVTHVLLGSLSCALVWFRSIYFFLVVGLPFLCCLYGLVSGHTCPLIMCMFLLY